MKKICMILVLCLMAMVAYGQTQIDIKAKGLDEDIGGYLNPNPEYSATTLIVGKIKFDEVTGLPVGQVEFHMTIYDVESGEKVYSMKGHLKNGTVIPPGFMSSPCPVREVTWINFWFVIGQGRVKTTGDAIENFEHRGEEINLPNTEGKYVPATIVMLVSPLGEHTNPDGYWEAGWAWAGVMGFEGVQFGGITYLTKYLEKWVP